MMRVDFSTGKAANGDSFQVSFGKLGDSCPAHCGTTSGDTLAFTSAADNLSAQDSNGWTSRRSCRFRFGLRIPAEGSRSTRPRA